MRMGEVTGEKRMAAKLRTSPGSRGRSKPAKPRTKLVAGEEHQQSGFEEVIDRDGANLPSILLLVLMSSAPALPLSDMHAPAVSALDDLWGKRKMISDKTRLSSETVKMSYSMVDLIRSVID
ncbi:hypothetical protein [Lichenicoccus sp.]|uniref:hypothetical protein n=1 Tax=Lichenicoccus sp. TaxID=2781899 RepID=UPI003D0CC02A